MHVQIPVEAAVYLPAAKVRERYGVTAMTLWRWLNDPALGFPRPVYLGRFRYWRIAELEAWERGRPRAAAKPQTKVA